MTNEIKHSGMTIDELQNAHSNMLATASDLGFEPPESTLVEINDQEQGVVVCDELHAAIMKFRAGVDEPLAPGKKRTQAAPASNKTKETKMTATETGKKAPAKSKTSSKTPAKKAKAKAPAKKAKAKTAPQTRTGYEDGAKIQWIFKGEGNGCREGTARYDRVEAVRKANGQTVKTFVAKGGSTATLRNAEKDGKVKVV